MRWLVSRACGGSGIPRGMSGELGILHGVLGERGFLRSMLGEACVLLEIRAKRKEFSCSETQRRPGEPKILHVSGHSV